ncbi:RNA polymerase sigma-70 factor [Spirosoma sp. KUDC1026]|uniref:RNA polymerase sigma-70 factor n=1 Tax=Spirosoma sp. KUDC1026 TaxID=2745947 RepID=UPI00159BCD00|nr:RNA polymerase sigma-70 factor [Spirosoma sp. KUDC1026]QKZ12792.1 RNA polymerase sigma-70 factor [Spirosoma sp. KUDC1026]
MPSLASTAYRHHADSQLTSALADGDRNAFAEIYDRYWSLLHRIAYQKLRSRETAEELVQDLFVSVWSRRAEATIRELRPYLLTALRFSIINYIESLRVHERFVAYYESFLMQTDTESTDELALQDLTNAIEQSLQTLPEKSQQVFRLSRFEYLTIPEIAQRLDLSEKAIEYHLTRALKVVRENLRNLGPLALFFFID